MSQCYVLMSIWSTTTTNSSIFTGPASNSINYNSNISTITILLLLKAKQKWRTYTRTHTHPHILQKTNNKAYHRCPHTDTVGKAFSIKKCFFLKMQMEVTFFSFSLSSEFSPFMIPDISVNNYWAYYDQEWEWSTYKPAQGLTWKGWGKMSLNKLL